MQRYAQFADIVIYLGTDMEIKKLKKKAKKSDSKGSKSKCREEQLGAYAKSTARAYQNGEGRWVSRVNSYHWTCDRDVRKK